MSVVVQELLMPGQVEQIAAQGHYWVGGPVVDAGQRPRCPRRLCCRRTSSTALVGRSATRMAIGIVGRQRAWALPQLRTTVAELSALRLRVRGGAGGLVDEARAWQGRGSYPGVDDYSEVTLAAGQRLEAGFPGLSNYAMDSGNAAAHGRDAAGVWESVQVGPGAPSGPFPGYRDSLVELHVTSDTVAATGITLHNPQYGPGGPRQYFLDIKQGIADGSISVLDHAGRPVPVPRGADGGGVEKVIRDSLGLGGTIRLVGAESPDFTRVVSTGNVETMPTWRTVLAGIGYETSLHTPSRGPAR